jgi:hypothetical protein
VDSFLANEDIQDFEHKLHSIVAPSCKNHVIELVSELFEILHHDSFPFNTNPTKHDLYTKKQIPLVLDRGLLKRLAPQEDHYMFIIVGTKTQECRAMNKEYICKSLDKVGLDHHLVKAPIPLSLLVSSS